MSTTTKITTRLLLAASLAFAGSAQAMSTAPVGNGSDYPAYAPSNSSLSRDQVRMQFTQARMDGTLRFDGNFDAPQFKTQQPGMGLSRAQVIEAASQARMAGTLPQGDSFGE
ncbi:MULTISPECIES: DUF4148 domain-containing protein [Comamonas]|jgi:hypothetical protein|uniref:DUF4148 domain-containing protein n=1 Tax=Comamonas squillarum TaxID=2977320 RepID=A0ABY5ZVH5_9BURK|nr:MULTISPECIES: DUF4148 domain-containing protein [Comamonas]PWB14596.1 hypothetical protein DCO45_21630 [Comamonas sp. JNW]UXC17962.1 DUF4148 domain-containing protein [Comamonas sp. PR12]